MAARPDAHIPSTHPSPARWLPQPRFLLGGLVLAGTCLMGGRLLVESGGAAVPGAERQMRVADCLWYSARNNGFLAIQKAAIHSLPGSAERRLWTGFVESVGQADCASTDVGLQTVTAALRQSEHAADRFLLGAQTGRAATRAHH